MHCVLPNTCCIALVVYFEKMASEPMSAEYAKSAKSACKGCMKNIAKGELRIGFVGKANFGTTAWYHYDCIWKNYENLKSIDSSKTTKSIVLGYSDLKEDEKTKLDADLPKYCKEAAEKAVAAAKERPLPMATEYAKSAKSSCKGCSKGIDKGALRVGFTGKANFGATAWYHYDCIWKDNENLKSIDGSKAAEKIIKGYSDLQDKDQDKLEADLLKHCSKPPAEKRKSDASKGKLTYSLYICSKKERL